MSPSLKLELNTLGILCVSPDCSLKVFIAECNLQIKLKNHSFPDKCLHELFSIFLGWGAAPEIYPGI